MTISLNSIIQLLKSKGVDFSIYGNDISISKMAAIGSPVEDALCYYVGDNSDHLAEVKKSIIICKLGLALDTKLKNTLILTEHPQLCFYYASSLFYEKPKTIIHNQAIIDKNADIGKGASIGAFSSIDECKIGKNVIIETGVRIHKGTIIGNDVHIQSNTVIGATGVMWTWDSIGNKVPCIQTGNVIIKDNVFIGANITIVKGSFSNRPTIIGKDTMISHGTMIGHGTIIGARNHFANNIAIAGSVTVGDNCFFGSGAIVRPHVKIPKGTIVGAGAVVVKDFLQEGIVLIGNPASMLASNKDKISGVPSPY